MNLEQMSLRELQDLQRQIARAIETHQDRAKKDALAKLNETARALGFTVEELLGQKKMRNTRAPAAAKYAHPDNSTITWSGRGRKPAWFNDALKNGASPDDLLVK